MSRKQHQQKLPHFGVSNKFIRREGIVKDADGKLQFAGTVSKAKRFMRTGSASR